MWLPTSPLGQSRTFWHIRMMSALPLVTDSKRAWPDVRSVPKGDVRRTVTRCLFDQVVGSREKDWGTISPNVFAVLRLMTSWYLVGTSTGRSCGFAPRKIRST